MKALLTLILATALAGSTVVTRPDLALGVIRRASPDVVYSVKTARPLVALSIDDGPSPASREILAVLQEQGVHATFFLIGDHVRQRPDQVRSMLAAGHEVAHHMMADEPSIELNALEFRNDFREMHMILADLGGSRLYRPGSGWYNERMVGEAKRRGYRVVLGSVYPFDAQIANASWSANYVLEHVAPGAIIILHDGAERGLRTAEVLRRVLPELRQRGLEVVTVSELLKAGEEERPAGALR